MNLIKSSESAAGALAGQSQHSNDRKCIADSSGEPAQAAANCYLGNRKSDRPRDTVLSGFFREKAMDRRRLFEFQKERIEHAYVQSTASGLVQPVVIAADASDAIAEKFLGHFLEPEQIDSIPKTSQEMVPTMVFAVEPDASFYQTVAHYFPDCAAFLKSELQKRVFYVLVLSDGSASVATHTAPE